MITIFLNTLEKSLIALAFLVCSFIIFTITYLLNKKAKVPDDCAKDELPEGCKSCMLSCGKRETPFSPLSDESKKDKGDK